MSNNKKAIIEAIDVGYGNTKHTMGKVGDTSVCSMFPSYTTQYVENKAEVREINQDLNTVTVEVNGMLYRVGEDIHHAIKPSHSKSLNTDYAKTDKYMALLKGALLRMGHDEIDLLVLGLPVSVFNSTTLKNELVEKVKGEQKLTEDKRVYIHDVWVLPQPFGGLLDFASSKEVIDSIDNEYTLIIDPGYFTLDWWTTYGITKPQIEMNGSFNGGVSAYLAAIAEAISVDIKRNVTDLWILDDAIRAGRNPKIGPTVVNLEKYLPIGKGVINEAVDAVANNISVNNNRINNIVLVGGGAHIFKDALEEKFTGYNIHIPNDHIYSNVRGFQIAGELKFGQKNRG